jgi:hypothetical protein
MTRDELIEAIRQLECARSDADTEAALGRVKSAAPHGRISDLIFYGERDRTHEEIADEALLRERIWAEGGDVALGAHIEAQLLAALADPNVPENHPAKMAARTLLDGMRTTRAH